jgi:hypothetical protein
MIEEALRWVRKQWLELSRPPRPSDTYVMMEMSMSHTKKAALLLPALRDDEKSYKSDDGFAIKARQLTYWVGPSDPVSVELALDASGFEIGGIPAGAKLRLDLSNKLENGATGPANSRTVSAPPLPAPIPTPDAVSVQFSDEPDEPPAT